VLFESGFDEEGEEDNNPTLSSPPSLSPDAIRGKRKDQ
jgi:hypothetical protein